MNVPNLRFPEFKDEWKERQLSDIASFSKGNGISKDQLSDDGEECILYGELYTKYKNEIIDCIISKTNTILHNPKRSQKGDILIPSSGETSLDIACARSLRKENVVIGGDLNVINVGDLNADFISYQLNGKRKNDIAKLSQGSSVIHLYNESIKKVKIFLPEDDECIKISTLLNLLDRKIETQMKIIEENNLFKDLYISNILSSNEVYELSIHEAMKQNEFEIVKSSQLKMFDGSRKYLSTSSIDKNGIASVECIVTYLNRPSRASMLPIKNSVWFAKMSNSNKVFVSCNNDENEYILSTGFYGLLPTSNTSSIWLSEIFKSAYFNNQKNRFSEGSSMSAIKDSQLNDINIKLFIDNNMQQKHLRYIKKLNSKIKIEGLLLENLGILKKDLLKKMLI